MSSHQKLFGNSKPYTSITTSIDQITNRYNESDSGGLVLLAQVLTVQSTGPAEAARAIRKKLTYGDERTQVRALGLLDDLASNEVNGYQGVLRDQQLIERLRHLPHGHDVKDDVLHKCRELFMKWSRYQNDPELKQIGNLYKQLPKNVHTPRQRMQQPANPFQEDEAREVPQVASSSSPSLAFQSSQRTSPPTQKPSGTLFPVKLKKDKKGDTSKPFNLAKEQDNIIRAIAQASIASTDLLNALQHVNPNLHRVSENADAVRYYKYCKALRKQLLEYIQAVESEEWIGRLLTANDDLIRALGAYEIIDRSVADGSDDDEDLENLPHGKSKTASGLLNAETQQQLAGLSLNEAAAPAKPPRPDHISLPAPPEDVVENEDDPFGDGNAAPTPLGDRTEPRWR